jgi:predicted DNA-binding transcriptional regulator YafY
LFAPRYYLVAATKSRTEPALYRLDRIHDIEVTDEPGAPPESFNLKAYASRSFGVFQEEPEDIIVSFDASAATDARAYLFHPTQSMTDETDGSLTVRFRAAGLLQIAHHLMTWGSTVTILAPENLKNMIWEQIEALHAHHRPAKKEVPAKGTMTS